jgi:hypothetical protein
MSDQAKKDAMEGLLREGSANYLDALYALHQFKRAVTDSAIAVWRKRLADLVSAVGIEGPAPTGVAAYCNPDGVGNECNGNWAWVAARVWFPEPWNGFCYLGLSFDREETGDACRAHVTFMCSSSRAATFTKLKSGFRDQDRDGFYYDDEPSRECGFTWTLRDPLAMTPEFEKMMDYAVDVWKRIGGWKQLPT